MKLIICDCDGTLVDSQNAIFGAMQHAFGGHGLPVPTRPQVLGVVGLSLPEAFAGLAPDLAATVRDELAHRYKGAFPHTGLAAPERDPLFPDAKAVVEQLGRREDVALGIATGKSLRGVHRLLEQEGWHDLFVTIQTADNHPSKPHPSMIVRAMTEAGVGPADTIMIGDTTYDITMGRNAGVKSVGVAWGYHDVSQLESAGADHIVDRFDALEAAIDRLLADRERRR